MCFNKRKKKLLEKAIEKFNEELDAAISDLQEYARGLDEDFGAMIDYYWDESFRRINWTRPTTSEVENGLTVEDLIAKSRELPEMVTESKRELLLFWKRAKKNITDLAEWDEAGVPLFITLSSVRHPEYEKLYAMCYEFKKIDKNKYKVFIFRDDAKEGTVTTFTPFDWKINKMTEEEFEKYYIMGRMGNGPSFDKETDAIEYNNSIRRLFHGQPKE